MKNVRKVVGVVVTCLTEAAVAETVTLRLSCVLLQLLSTTSAVATFVSEAVCKISFAFDEERISVLLFNNGERRRGYFTSCGDSSYLPRFGGWKIASVRSKHAINKI